jgi:DNA-binding NtrC family response regulator
VDVRLVVATNRNLEADMKAGRFREDLYYRLNVVRLRLPPLRDRLEDLPQLVETLLQRISSGASRRIAASPEVLGLLAAHRWPGNVRELANALQHACSMCAKGMLRPEHLPPQLRGTGDSGGTVDEATTPPFKEAKDQVVQVFEKNYLAQLLEKHGGNISRAAREAGLGRRHFRELIRKYGIVDGVD